MKMSQEYSIKDLETFSGIRAHTIRIWEQRYGILVPERSETNIRKYTDKDLKTLLHVSLLNNIGYKISRISAMSEMEIREKITEATGNEHREKHIMHVLRIAMISFDEGLFHEVINKYLGEKGMEAVIRNIFLPFLKEVGNLWLADSICPAHEHFVSSLIRQKLLVAVDSLQLAFVESGQPIVYFLPEYETHELSLIMMHYIMRKNGKRSIFLGSGISLDDLVQVQQRLGNVAFVSIFTTRASTVLMPLFLENICRHFRNTNCHFYLTGTEIKAQRTPDPQLITIAKDVDSIIDKLFSDE